jgi:enamine deaminase RidA (YjgF/YER057c/UK114 family)
MSGTVGMDYRTQTISPDPAEQTEQAIRNIQDALSQCGATLENVLRLRVYIAERDDLEPICRVIGDYFRPYKPANTTVIAQLNDPRMKVEIEVTARLGSVG